MARVLVTGGSGFVGSHLVDHLVDAGDEVTVFDAAPPPAWQRRGGSGTCKAMSGMRKLSPRPSPMASTSCITSRQWWAWIRYLAVPADVVEINLLGTLNVLRQAHAAQAKIVIASTSEVYGKNPATPWQEDADRVLGSTAVDRWSYSTSKALAEHLTFAYIRQHGAARRDRAVFQCLRSPPASRLCRQPQYSPCPPGSGAGSL